MKADQFVGKYYPVLNKGFVSLVDYMGGDESIEQAARVSYGKGTRKVSETRGLIRYLVRHRHTTPLEMVELKFHCAMPMFVARQWVRHRTASLNEYSGRYSVMPKAFYTPDEWRSQSKKNRQGSEGVLPPSLQSDLRQMQRYDHETSWVEYEHRLEEDVAREQARIDLPLSMYTEWYWKIDLHNLFHFLSLRMDPHAQLEIREYANIMAGLTASVAPLAFEAFLDYQFNSYGLSRVEIEALRDICAGGRVNEDELQVKGMSNREVREFKNQMFGEWEPLGVEDLVLDSDDALTPEQARIRLHGEDL